VTAPTSTWPRRSTSARPRHGSSTAYWSAEAREVQGPPRNGVATRGPTRRSPVSPRRIVRLTTAGCPTHHGETYDSPRPDVRLTTAKRTTHRGRGGLSEGAVTRS